MMIEEHSMTQDQSLKPVLPTQIIQSVLGGSSQRMLSLPLIQRDEKMIEASDEVN